MILSILTVLLIILCCISAFFIVFYRQNQGCDLFLPDETDNLFKKSVLAHKTDNTHKAVIIELECDEKKPRLKYAGLQNCRLFKKVYGNIGSSGDCCLGFGDCIPVCPQRALSLKNGKILISSACNGCGLCIPLCPQQIIHLKKNKNT